WIPPSDPPWLAVHLLMPGPGGCNDRLQVAHRRPPFQVATSGGRIGDQSRRVAGPPRADPVRHGAPCHLLDRVDYFADTEAVADAEVVGIAVRPADQTFQRRNMRLRSEERRVGTEC